MFTGTGGGSLDPPAHFTLDTDGDKFAESSQVLAAAHLNDDGLLDLVAAPGRTFLGRAAAANRPPTAFAWEYQPPWDGYIRLEIQAADPDYDFLTYRWTDASGAPVGGALERTCIEPSPGDKTYHVDRDRWKWSERRSPCVGDPVGLFPSQPVFRQRARRHQCGIALASHMARQTRSDDTHDRQIRSFRIDRRDHFPSHCGMQRATWSGERLFLATTRPPRAMSSSGSSHAVPVGRLRAPTCRGIVYGTPPSAPPSPWQGQDIGAVGRPGSATYFCRDVHRLRLGCGHLGHRGRVPLPLSTAALRWRSGRSSCGSRRVKCLDESGRDDSRIADARFAARVDVREPRQRGRVPTAPSPPAERAFTRLRQRRRRRTWLKVTRRDKYIIRVFHSADGLNWGNSGLKSVPRGAGTSAWPSRATTTPRSAPAFLSNISIGIHHRDTCRRRSASRRPQTARRSGIPQTSCSWPKRAMG